jgi:hypothetical protein
VKKGADKWGVPAVQLTPRSTKKAARKKAARRASRASATKPGTERSGTEVHVDPSALAKATTYAGVSSAAVRSATGKTWNEWFAILDAHGAARLEHKEIAEYLSAQRNVTPWWSQMVTVGYEQARGLRKKHEMKQGFSVSASRVVAAPISKSWRAFADPKLCARWYTDKAWDTSTATKERTMRGAFGDGTRLEVHFYRKGANRSQISLQHSRLENEQKAQARKSYWGRRLDALRALLETSAL